MTEYKAPTFYEPMRTVTTTSTTGGLRQERNHGLKLSRTEYIGYLDEDHAPVVDMAQEVVRCRDCEYYDEGHDLDGWGPKCWRDPDHRGTATWTQPDGFCWLGERKEA